MSLPWLVRGNVEKSISRPTLLRSSQIQFQASFSLEDLQIDFKGFGDTAHFCFRF